MKYDKRKFFIQLSTSAAHWESDAQTLMAAKVKFIVSGFEPHHAKKHAKLFQRFNYTFGRNDGEPLTFFHQNDWVSGQSLQD